MSDATIDIEVDLKATKSSLDKMSRDVKESVSDTLFKKQAEIQKNLSGNIYKHGQNHLKTKGSVSALRQVNSAVHSEKREQLKTQSANKKIESSDASEKLKSTILQEKHDRNLAILNKKTENLAIKNKREELKLEKEKEKSQSSTKSKSFFENIFSGKTSLNKGLSVFDEKKGTSELNTTKSASFLSGFGIAGAVAAAVLIAGKTLKTLANNPISYGAKGLGTGFGGAGIASLLNGKVVNQQVGEDFADTLQKNRISFSQGNRFRNPEIVGKANELLARFGDRSYENLRTINNGTSSTEIYQRLQEDIRKSSEESALAAGEAFNISPETILAIRNGKDVVGSLSKASQNNQEFNDPNVINRAFSATGAVDSAKGSANLLATDATLKLVQALDKLTGQVNLAATQKTLFPGAGTNSSYSTFYSTFLPGNTAAGNV